MTILYMLHRKQEYNIRYAIHNHGPEDELYPTAESILICSSKNLILGSGSALTWGTTQEQGMTPLPICKNIPKEFSIYT